ncbi:MAG: ACP S-malonyltransferase [Pseudomonadota bacterium]
MAMAFVFPGQGSQSVGMLADLAADEPLVRETFDEASTGLDYDLWELVSNGPEDKLMTTECTQPAMLAAGVAVWRVWRARNGPAPSVMSGHSLGEYTALVCAKALDFVTAISLVAFRGRVMQEAVPVGQGAMAAIIGLDDKLVERSCAEAAQGDVVEAVNYNAPGQVVIAGTVEAVERAVAAAKGRGARRAVMLPVTVPAHSSLMRGAAAKMRERLADTDIRTPLVPEMYTVDVRKHGSPDDIRRALVKQLYSPVRWTDTVRAMVTQGVVRIVECGPGKILTGLNRRVERRKQIHVFAIHDSASIDATLKDCLENEYAR